MVVKLFSWYDVNDRKNDVTAYACCSFMINYHKIYLGDKFCNEGDGLLWSPYVIGQTIIFLPCDFYLSSFFFYSSPNLSRRRLDVYHTSTHGVALVRI